ncbi:MAG: response regulator [Hahellaceae bacterium]|nr:response regulator [Hahellaceae bacterium]MCP5170135.1 response regulator [Hahellaceae bacterium]
MYKALVVDDSKTAQKVLGSLLKKQNILVEVASSGEEALQVLASYRPDIIFLDHMMPGMDGFQTLQAIKGNGKTNNIPVVMFTSQNAQKYEDEARQLGASGVIPKQVSSAVIGDLMASLVVNRSSADLSPVERAATERVVHERPAPERPAAEPVSIPEVRMEEALDDAARIEFAPMDVVAELEKSVRQRFDKISQDMHAANDSASQHWQSTVEEYRAQQLQLQRKIRHMVIGIVVLSLGAVFAGHWWAERSAEVQSAYWQAQFEGLKAQVEKTSVKMPMTVSAPGNDVQQQLDLQSKKLAELEGTLLEHQMTLRDISEVQEQWGTAPPAIRPAKVEQKSQDASRSTP